MRRRRWELVALTSVAVCAVLVAAGEAYVRNHPGARLAAPASAADNAVPDAAPYNTTAAFMALDQRIKDATADAAAQGADISVQVLDRVTGQSVSNGNNAPIGTASVAKLFIADDLLFQESNGQIQLSAVDHADLDAILQSSDDTAAEEFWDRSGDDDIITRVAARYGLTATFPPHDGHWWNTHTTTADLVRYYAMLLDGTGGLLPDQANVIVNDLSQFTPQAADGYPQRFGIPDGLYAEQVAAKQGWMCCVGTAWMHLSTGVIGPQRRYVMAIESEQSTDDDTARATITQAVKTIFPNGRIGGFPADPRA
jgi:hypothetical protein